MPTVAAPGLMNWLPAWAVGGEVTHLDAPGHDPGPSTFADMPRQLFAGISISDYALALEWYERLLGQPPSFSPNDVESVWDVNDSGWIYVEHRPHHAGHALVTVFVDDIEALVASIAARGIDPTRRETYENGVHKATYKDADGNEIGFGGQLG